MALEIALKPAPAFTVTDFETQPDAESANPFIEKFRSSIMDQTKDYPLPVSVIGLKQDGKSVPFLSLKSCSLWQGKQKSKKTTALALAVAAFISGRSNNDTGTQFTADIEGKVLFFDNEQGESYAARTMRLILKLANVQTSSKLIYCDLREHSPKDRNKIIEAGIESTGGVRLVIIDGLVDLLTDFMDAGEGHQTITDILKLCSRYDIHVAGVLHQNKNDKNARAHIGTISSQKCEVEISTEVDPDDRSQSIVSCVNSRSLPFEPFAIRWDKESLPRVSTEWNPHGASDNRAKKSRDRAIEQVSAIWQPLTVLTHSEAVAAIMNLTTKSKSTAKRTLEDWQIWNLVNKGADGNYRKKPD